MNDVSFSKQTPCGITLRFSNTLFHLLLLILPPKTFFNKGFAISPKNGAAADASSPIGNPLSLFPFFAFFFLNLFFTPYVPNTVFLQIVFLLFQ